MFFAKLYCFLLLLFPVANSIFFNTVCYVPLKDSLMLVSPIAETETECVMNMIFLISSPYQYFKYSGSLGVQRCDHAADYL